MAGHWRIKVMPQVASTQIMGQGINGTKIDKGHNLTKPENVDDGRTRMATLWKQHIGSLEGTIDKLGD